MAIRGFRVASAFIVVAGVASGALARSATAGVRPSAGTTITVNTTADDIATDGNCSLREALQAANTDTAVDACPAGNGDDTIVLSGATYTLIHGALEVSSAVTIRGDFLRTIIDGNAQCCGTDRALHVNTGADLSLDGVSIQHAAPAIRNDGTLDMMGGNLDTNLASWPNSDHSNGIANFGTFTGGTLFRYTTNPIYNAPGAALQRRWVLRS